MCNQSVTSYLIILFNSYFINIPYIINYYYHIYIYCYIHTPRNRNMNNAKTVLFQTPLGNIVYLHKIDTHI